jgi:hypothetical protein
VKQKYYKTDEFRKLQKSWYDKLEKSGFEDIEYYVDRLKNPLSSPFLKGKSFTADQLKYQNPYQFYRILSLFLHSPDFLAYFDPKWHKFNTFLLQNYINGASIRDLAKLV